MCDIRYAICPKCSYFTIGITEQMFCPACGLRLRSECVRCGAEVRNPYAIFCPACGALHRPPGHSHPDPGKGVQPSIANGPKP